MKTQTEALRLADALGKYRTPPEAAQAAAELHRLHESNTELLAALKEILDGEGKSFRELCEQARAAINKAEGEMK